jgi:hypothetical protein
MDGVFIARLCLSTYDTTVCSCPLLEISPPPPMAESQVCGGVCRVMHIASRDSGLVAHRFEFVRFVDRV